MANVRWFPVLAGLVLVFTAGCGRAGIGAPVPPDAGFASRDLDGDGALDRDEAGLPGVAFDARDRDGDGKLSGMEWQGAEASAADNALNTQITNENLRQGRPAPPPVW